MRKRSVLVNNIAGVTANILQNLFLSFFFIILARAIGPDKFSGYVLGNSLYQIVGAFSTMGLSNYFIREYVSDGADNRTLLLQFIWVELILGGIAMMVLAGLAFSLYASKMEVIVITLVLGINILFDNLIYCFKAVHVAERMQYRFIRVIVLEAFLKLLLAAVFYWWRFDFMLFLCILVAYRCITLLMAWRSVPQDQRAFGRMRFPLNRPVIKKIFHAGKVFVIIGSINVVFWRVNILILSKMAEEKYTSCYEVAFKFFAIAQIIPVIMLSTVYPLLAQYYNTDRQKFTEIAQKSFLQMLLFSTMVTLLACFLSPYLIPFFLGNAYADAARMTQHMFITLIPFSLSLVQAYTLVASKNEKIDMWLNIINLSLNTLLAPVLIWFTGPMGSITSLTISFSVFFLLQQYFLYKKGLSFWKPVSRPFWWLLLIVTVPVLFSSHAWILLPALAALLITAWKTGLLNRSILIKDIS